MNEGKLVYDEENCTKFKIPTGNQWNESERVKTRCVRRCARVLVSKKDQRKTKRRKIRRKRKDEEEEEEEEEEEAEAVE